MKHLKTIAILISALAGFEIPANAEQPPNAVSSDSAGERYKTAITSMGSNTKKLQQLRPVTFHLKTDPDGALQYGLIAEEVDKVYPELVIRDGGGKIQGVRYDELAPMLLNEVQRLQRQIQDQQRKLSEVEQLKEQVAQLMRLNRTMQAAIANLLEQHETLASR